MLHNAKNGTIDTDNLYMEYIRFGTGPRTLIMLPGLGDGLHSVKGMALPMALLYRKFARDYTVYAFSRRSNLAAGHDTRNMADDLSMAMDALGIEKAHIMGVSMGGMIAQHFAAVYPEKLDKLVLVVSCPEPNPILESSVSLWMSQAEAGDHKALMDSNLRLIYSGKYYRQNKWLTPLIGLITKPKSYERFLILANACLSHNALDALPHIQSPALVIGGEKDQTLGAEPSRQLHRHIKNSRLHIYPKGHHGLYEEEKDFNQRVLDFLNE